MKFSTDCSTQDIYQGLKLDYFSGNSYIIVLAMGLVIGIVDIVAAVYVAIVSPPSLSPSFLILFAIGLFCSFFLIGQPYSLTYLQALFIKSKLRPTDWEINENGVSFANDLGTHTLTWKAFNKMVKNKNIALVYSSENFIHHAHFINRKVFFMFPRRLFTNDQWAELVKILEAHVASKT